MQVGSFVKASDERLLCGNIKTEKTAYAISSEEWKNREQRLEFERRREGSESRTRYNSFVRACCIEKRFLCWVGELGISEPDNRIATLSYTKKFEKFTQGKMHASVCSL